MNELKYSIIGRGFWNVWSGYHLSGASETNQLPWRRIWNSSEQNKLAGIFIMSFLVSTAFILDLAGKLFNGYLHDVGGVTPHSGIGVNSAEVLPDRPFHNFSSVFVVLKCFSIYCRYFLSLEKNLMTATGGINLTLIQTRWKFLKMILRPWENTKMSYPKSASSSKISTLKCT